MRSVRSRIATWGSVTALSVVVVGALAARAAGPWHRAPAANLNGADVATGLALRGDGNGYAVTWNDAADVTTILEATHTLTAGPAFAVREQVPAAAARPVLAYQGATVLVAWSDAGAVRRGTFGNALSAGQSTTANVPVRALAIDALGSDAAVAGLFSGIPFVPNAARTGNAFATTGGDLVIEADSSDVVAVAVRGTAGVAVVTSVGLASIYVTADVVTQAWDALDPAPSGLALGAVITSNVDGAVLAMGANGDGAFLSGFAGPVVSCTFGPANATAIASLGSIFWVGRDNGTIDVVDPVTDCNTAPAITHTTGLTRLDALTVVDEDVVVALGLDGATTVAAWKNRPPLAPAIVGGGDIDDDTVATATASATDPDLAAGGDDPQTYAWACDPALSATGVASAVVTVTTPSLCVDPALPSQRTTLSCNVTSTDSDGVASPPANVTFAVLPRDGEAPVVTDVNGLSTDDIVLSGTDLAFTVVATDACPYQATWTVRDEATGTIRAQQTDDWATAFAFTAVTQGADALTWYTLEVIVDDTAGNPSAAFTLRFGVGVPQPPLEVQLACPATVVAGATGTATATPAPTSGLVLEYTWLVSGAATLADAAPTDDVLTFQTDACDGGAEALVRMQPHGLFEDGALQSCTVGLLDPPDPAPPSLTLAEAPVLDVVLGEQPVTVLLHPSVAACAAHPVDVRWDLSALPAALWPAGTDDGGALVLGRAEALQLVVEPAQLAALHGMEVAVRATAVDGHTALTSSLAEVRLRFGADGQLTALAGVDVELAITEVGPVAEGELVTVAGTIATDVSVALPSLTVVLASDGFAAVPGSVVTDSTCGARATVAHQGSDAVLTLDGVSAACPLQVRLLVRRGFGSGGLRARDCTWGVGRTPLARCDGGTRLTAPPTLSCAAVGSAPVLVVVLALVWRPRRRR